MGESGKKYSPEAIEKMRNAHLGKKHSPESIAKMRESAKKSALARKASAPATSTAPVEPVAQPK
jgi:hypothetical protein